MELRLNQLPPGVDGTVTAVGGGKLRRCRLKSLGLTPGVSVCVHYRSPAGGVTVLALGKTLKAVERKDLRRICVRME